MSRNRTAGAPMRMGMLNILVVVIALCLAVLSVLALSTARAGAALSERQAANVTETYAVESVGEELLAHLDEALTSFQAGGIPADRLVDAVNRNLQDYRMVRTQQADLAEPGIQFETSTLTSEELEAALGVPNSDAGTLGALDIQVTGPSGHALSAIVALNDDGTYSVMQWKTMKLWEDDVQAEGLLRTSE